MELNEITCIGYKQTGNTVYFDLECDFETANALDGEELKVTADGEDMAVFGGYQLVGLEKDGEYTRAKFAQALEPNTEQVLSAIQKNLEIANKNLTANEKKTQSAQTSADSANKSASDAREIADANAAAILEMAEIVYAE